MKHAKFVSEFMQTIRRIQPSISVKSSDERTAQIYRNCYVAGKRPVRSTFAVRETASLGIMGEPRVPPLNPSETIVLSEPYRRRGV